MDEEVLLVRISSQERLLTELACVYDVLVYQVVAAQAALCCELQWASFACKQLLIRMCHLQN